MSAVERVQAAIDKLTAERDKGTPGPWKPYESIQADTFIIGPRGFIYDEIIAGPTYERANVGLIVTLHRTIDAQLAILERWLEYRPLQMEEPIVALADAILGADS